MYSEDDVDHSTSLDCYVVVNIIEDIRHESSTAPSCRTLVFYAVATYEKALGTIFVLGLFMWQVAC